MTNAYVLKDDQKSGYREYPGHAPLGISTFRLSYNKSDRGWKTCSHASDHDHFMQCVQALITSSQTAKCTAQALWDTFIVHFGLPESIVFDQDQNQEQSCGIWQECENCVLALTIHKQMGSVNVSIIH